MAEGERKVMKIENINAHENNRRNSVKSKMKAWRRKKKAAWRNGVNG
jgi:hypothetical protein